MNDSEYSEPDVNDSSSAVESPAGALSADERAVRELLRETPSDMDSAFAATAIAQAIEALESNGSAGTVSSVGSSAGITELSAYRSRRQLRARALTGAAAAVIAVVAAVGLFMGLQTSSGDNMATSAQSGESSSMNKSSNALDSAHGQDSTSGDQETMGTSARDGEAGITQEIEPQAPEAGSSPTTTVMASFPYLGTFDTLAELNSRSSATVSSGPSNATGDEIQDLYASPPEDVSRCSASLRGQSLWTTGWAIVADQMVVVTSQDPGASGPTAFYRARDCSPM
ncbi:MAG: hypothetical protein KDB26_07625 [Microthrixaceae bacterium]|nr:hypothetical protein [Microthrixaceae bacterium]